MFDIKEELKKLPDSPGCYLHKDEFGNIIYVGKAVNLKNRVRQYFQSPKNQTPKTREMVKHIAEFEYIAAGSEMEALILECNLIKRYRPKYNILLRDDKTYPYVKVTLKEEWPRVVKTRRLENDGSKYFGPFADAGSVNVIIDLLNSLYSLKRCNARSFPVGHTPCLNYHIHQCRGICTGTVDKEEYMESVDKAVAFLSGRDNSLRKELKEEMERASAEMRFEDAAKLRDHLTAIESLSERQRVVLSHPEDLDVLLVVSGLAGAHVLLFTVRGGKLSGRESFFLGDTSGETEGYLVAEFIKRYYSESLTVPKEILLAQMPPEKELLEQWLSGMRGSSVSFLVPMRGEKRALMDVVRKDAEVMLRDIDERARRQQEKDESLRKQLVRVFGEELGGRLNRVESYDISHIQGVDSVGAMVVFEDGRPNKKAYRRFKIRTIEGNDDTASLTEVLFRRFKKAKEGDPGFAQLPDAVFMDGGAGQVNAAKDVLFALGLNVPVAGMVKDNKHRTRALLYEGVEYPLTAVRGSGKDGLDPVRGGSTGDAAKGGSAAGDEAPEALGGMRELFAYCGRLQEEVHRFAIEYHRSLRGKAVKRSVLDNVPGIGEKRKLSLLNTFGSVDGIKAASKEDLAKAPGMNARVAEQVFAYFAGAASTGK
ncbi:MAG: excinuclease ABC subunit UvrC [Firmicutes bacterium]|nr:excinuclease ABC subunit UvrC [Bacillota bacterium]